jgi:drug/metabolite transporter (DMT)-like permease
MQTTAGMPTLIFLTAACGVSSVLGTVLHVGPEIVELWRPQGVCCCQRRRYQPLEASSAPAVVSSAAAAGAQSAANGKEDERSCWGATRRVYSSNRYTWLFALLVLLRTLTNIFSTKLTLAVYAQVRLLLTLPVYSSPAALAHASTPMLTAHVVSSLYFVCTQLLNLLTPFVVALGSRWLFREPLPRFTLPALLVSLCGALMVLLGPYITNHGAGLHLTSDDGKRPPASLVPRSSLLSWLLAQGGAFCCSCCRRCSSPAT